MRTRWVSNLYSTYTLWITVLPRCAFVPRRGFDSFICGSVFLFFFSLSYNFVRAHQFFPARLLLSECNSLCVCASASKPTKHAINILCCDKIVDAMNLYFPRMHQRFRFSLHFAYELHCELYIYALCSMDEIVVPPLHKIPPAIR